MRINRLLIALYAMLVVGFVFEPASAKADQAEWKRQPVNWRANAGGQIKAVYYRTGEPLDLRTRAISRESHQRPRKTTSLLSDSGLADYEVKADTQYSVGVINSPPIAGFIPYIAVQLTNQRQDEFEFDAVPSSQVIGSHLTAQPEINYTIGIYDTGASGHIIGASGAQQTGLADKPGLYTANTVDLMGVTGMVGAWVSQPLAVFVDGLGAIDSNSLILDNSWMVGETNVSVMVGDPLDSPLLPTAIGSPMSVYFTAVIWNDKPVTIVRDGNEYTAPDIWFYDTYDPCVPDFANTIPLQMLPAGAASVQYMPDVFGDPFDPDGWAPMSPSIITSGLLGQSLFFASSVDITHGARSSIDKEGFMVDTGAQVTVISKAIAARLSLDVRNPNFWVEIVDVTGESTMQPSFYLDSFEVAASPEWLSLTNVPVVVLDVASPEGGTLDGIVGMNLFTEFNLVFQGGGLPDYGGHELRFEPLPPRAAADIWPVSGDGNVDIRDIAEFARAWLTTPNSELWLTQADLAPQPDGDNIIDFQDFAIFAQQWLYSSEQ